MITPKYKIGQYLQDTLHSSIHKIVGYTSTCHYVIKTIKTNYTCHEPYPYVDALKHYRRYPDKEGAAFEVLYGNAKV